MSSFLAAPNGYSLEDLVFNDSFIGTQLDSTWEPYLTNQSMNGAPWDGNGNGGSGTDSIFNENYDEPSQVSVNNGLTLTAVEQSVNGVNWGGSTPETYAYTSGAVSSYGNFEFDGGYLQISMKEPAGDGAWPALWLLPGATSSEAAGSFEIDMQEGGDDGGTITNVDDSVNYNLHQDYYTTSGGNTNAGVNLTAGFNTYGIDWVPGQSITWYLNGTEVGRVVQGQMGWDSATDCNAPISIPNTPMFLMMNLGVANSEAAGWHTSADGSTPTSMAMQIADVQLYQVPGSGETVTGSDVRTLTGGGYSVDLAGTASHSVLLANTQSNWDTVRGSQGRATLMSAQASILGGADTIYADSASWTSLYQTNGNADTVNGSGTNVILVSAQASIYGGSNTVVTTAGSTASLYQTNNNWDTVDGSSTVINLKAAQASIVGAGNTIDADSGSSLSLYQTGTNWDGVNQTNGSVALVDAHGAIYGGGETIYAYNGSAAALFQTNGNWDTVYMTNEVALVKGAQASIVGWGNTMDLDPGSIVSIYQTTNGVWDAVNGSNAQVIENRALVSIYGGGDIVYANTGSWSNLFQTNGNWDAVYGSNENVVLNSAQASILGGGNFVDARGGSSVSLYNTDGNSDSMVGSSESLALVDAQASLTGNDDLAYFQGASSLSFDGSSETLNFGANIGQATISGFDSSDTIQLSVADWSSFAALQSSGDLTQQGANTIIALSASNRITLLNEQISALSSAQFAFS